MTFQTFGKSFFLNVLSELHEPVANEWMNEWMYVLDLFSSYPIFFLKNRNKNPIEFSDDAILCHFLAFVLRAIWKFRKIGFFKWKTKLIEFPT